MARPRKIKFPLDFVVMLRLAMPKQRPEDRFKFFRMLVRESLHGRFGRLPTKDEIDDEMNKAAAKKYHDDHAFNLRLTMGECLGKFKAENRKIRAQIAASKRWAKKP